MGLRFKILSGFLILSVMLLVAGLWSVWEVTSIGSSVQGILDENYRSINAAKQMLEALEREDSAVLLLLSGRRKEGRQILESAHAAFKKAYKIVKGNVTIPDEKDYVDRIDSGYSNYRNLWKSLLADKGEEKSLQWYFQEVHDAFQEAKVALDELVRLNDQSVYQTASAFKGRAQRAFMPGTVAIFAALGFSLLFNYLVNYYVVNPIIQVTRGIQDFVRYGKSLDVQVETEDELADLLGAIRELVAQPGLEESQ